MKKIIGILNPFDLIQTFYVYEDKQEIGIMQGKIEDISNIIFALSQEYNVNNVDLSGSKSYVEGIIKKIQNQERVKYNKNTLNFRCI